MIGNRYVRTLVIERYWLILQALIRRERNHISPFMEVVTMIVRRVTA